MPRFDRGVVNTKLEKGDIVLMGNPTQYGEILAENILIEDILKADLETLISGSNLVRGKFYRITNAVSSTLSLLVQGLTANTICDYAYNTANGDLVTYNISTDLAGVPFSSVYVPYTGATADVNLGEYQIKVGQLELDQTPTGTFGVGKIRWNDTDGTPEVMLKGANVTLQIGQEQLARVVNKTNTNLTEAGYQVVRISGAQGQRLKVGLAQANSTSTCKDTLGLVTENISNNAEGFITTSGLVRNINTTGSLQGETWADGDRLYLSPSVAGGITNVEPSAPNIVIVLGYVVYAHATQGSIYVSVEGAKALHELFDVSIPTPTNNNVLVYESSTGLWKDKSISTILGYTPIANNATVGGELSGTLPNPSLVTSAVTGKALTGLSVSGSAVVSTDSILTGIGKLQNQINAVVGSVNFQGVWNASTNSPSLASGVGTKGYYYVVSVAGSTNLDGITDWKLGDWAIYDGTAWQKVDNTDAVVSVNGYTGIVTLAAADVGALPTSAISGTTGKLPKFTASGTIGDSIITEGSGGVSINGSLPNTDTTIHSTKSATNFLDLQSTTINQTVGVISRSASKSYFTGLNYSAVDIWEVYDITSGASRLKIGTTGQIITRNATDTGEAHIFGGSARVNGQVDIIGALNTFGALVTINKDNEYLSSTAQNASVAQFQTWRNSAGTRRGYFGFPSAGDDTLSLVNETGGGLSFTGAATFSSSVGVGTNPTNAKLEVVATTGEVFRADANGGAARVVADQTGVYLGGDTQINGGELFVRNSTTESSGYQLNALTMGYNVAGAYGWITAGGAASRTTLYLNQGGGNIVLGNAADDTVNKLQVSGSVRATGFEVGNGEYFKARRASGNLLLDLLGIEAGTDNTRLLITGDFNVKDGGGTSLFKIASTGAATFSSNVDINGTTLNLGNNTIVDSYTGNSSTYRVLVLTDQTANTNIGLNYNPISNVGSAFNGTGQIFIAHNKGIIASNAAGNNYIGVLRPIGTGVYFGGSLSSGELAGDGLFISTTGAATFSSSVTVSSGGITNGRLGVRGTTNDSSAYAFEAANASGSTLFIVRNDGVTSVDNKFLIGTLTPGASKLSVVGLPTSASGLSTGDVWNDGGTLKIV